MYCSLQVLIEGISSNLFRLRCYLASLHGTELPNPQTLLASISKPTKLALGKVGVFSVASLHAIVSVPTWYHSMTVWGYGRME